MQDYGPPQVVVTLDEAYTRHAAVTLLSVLEHTPGACVYALVPGDFSQSEILQKTVGPALRIVPIDAAQFETFQVWEGGSTATYIRLLIGSVLPLSRAIYLDCDILVRASLAPLWNIDMGGCPAGAVLDQEFQDRERLGLAADAPYFNTGVMLLDLDRWRAENLATSIIGWARENPGRLSFADQCALNWQLQGRWLPLGPEWNLQAGQCGRVTAQGFKFDRVPQGDPAIVHFNAPPGYGRHGDSEGKPWMYLCQHPWRFEYRRVAAHTPWAGLVATDTYPHNRILHTLRNHADWATPAYRALRRVI